jgi:hypothetical protein
MICFGFVCILTHRHALTSMEPDFSFGAGFRKFCLLGSGVPLGFSLHLMMTRDNRKTVEPGVISHGGPTNQSIRPARKFHVTYVSES